MRGRARTLKDFRRCEINTVGTLMFRFGMSAREAMAHCAIPPARMRLVAKAILRAVKRGETDSLDAATVAAARKILAARESTTKTQRH